MGQDYDSDQPSSSSTTSPPFLKKKLHFMRMKPSSYMVAEPAQYPPPAEAVTQLGTHNSVDLMAMEEMSDDLQTQLSELKEQGIKSEQKLLKLEKTVVVCLLVSALVLIAELQRVPT
ncbi:hypothetical protein Bca52824_067212 [Brassica carinata]|uniref:Uncharacterized protein n=1 Tax=Brassica carinata TaxID=52824 RepID=A0A8X7UBJ1_BRACI|nr:hypothetical protein Bca52824_067212 [Brassica carinata]